MRSKVGVGPSENFVFGQIWRPLTDALDATMFFQKSCQRSPARQAAKTVPKTAVYAAPTSYGFQGSSPDLAVGHFPCLAWWASAHARISATWIG